MSRTRPGEQIRPSGFRGPLEDWQSLDRWATVAILVLSGFFAVVCTQLSGLLTFSAMDCNGAVREDLMGAAYAVFGWAPAVLVLAASAAVVVRARHDRSCWPFSVAVPVLIWVAIAGADQLARLATASC